MAEEPREISLIVAIREGAALAEVHGRGSFKMGPALKRFGISAITRHQCDRIVLNMLDCETMDSTFMGVLAGLAMRLKKQTGGCLIVCGLSERTMHLLSTLGLDKLVETYTEDDCPDQIAGLFGKRDDLESVEVGTMDRRESVTTMLDAHKDLVAASPDNLARFQDVIEYLQRDEDELSRETD